MDELVFLKLGGSLITDKTRPYTPRREVLSRLAVEIAKARLANPDLSLVLGHGSGSFGHTAAKKHGTRQGVHDPAGWDGFVEVWFQAMLLNRYVMSAMSKARLPALALAPVSAVIASAGQVTRWDLTPLKRALEAGLIPVIYGDVVFDEAQGGTILSTEDLFEHLALELRPQRILLAGLETAVWADFPICQRRVEQITPPSYQSIRVSVGGSHGADVTGGMASKVQQMLGLVEKIPGLKAQIFSGAIGENVTKALAGENLGTIICN
jgi:isopentenyl phosphate kinase